MWTAKIRFFIMEIFCICKCHLIYFCCMQFHLIFVIGIFSTFTMNFLHTMLSFPTPTHSYISSYCSSTTSHCLNVHRLNATQMYCTNINVFIQHCCSGLGLWRSSSLTNGRDSVGQTPNFIDLQDCDPHFIIVASRVANGSHFPVNFCKKQM